MPTYEYECTKCGAVVDLVQPITEAARKKLKKDDPKPCKCGAAVQRRIGTGGGLIFKGSGFYKTDYRSDGYKQSAKSEKESADGKSKSDGKPDSKPASSGDGGGKTGSKDATSTTTATPAA